MYVAYVYHQETGPSCLTNIVFPKTIIKQIHNIYVVTLFDSCFSEIKTLRKSLIWITVSKGAQNKNTCCLGSCIIHAKKRFSQSTVVSFLSILPSLRKEDEQKNSGTFETPRKYNSQLFVFINRVDCFCEYIS